MSHIEKQIQELHAKLQSWEDIDPLYTDDRTKELRHKIFHVHARTEKSLEILLGNYLLSSVDNKLVLKGEKLNFYRRFTQILANTDFSKKVTSVQAANLLDSKLIGKIHKLNTLRVMFSHPSAYEDDIRTYSQNLTKELKVLELLVSVYEGLSEVFARSN